MLWNNITYNLKKRSQGMDPSSALSILCSPALRGHPEVELGHVKCCHELESLCEDKIAGLFFFHKEQLSEASITQAS